MPGTLSFCPSFCVARYNLEIAIFLGVGRQFVGADIDLTPLEALPMSQIASRLVRQVGK